jgi:hypothetical protein
MSEYQNPFVKEVYADGDMDYSPSEWRSQIDEHNARSGKIEHSSENIKDHLIKEDEIALKHPQTGATVKLCDDGCIDIFAGEQLGLRLDPSNKSALIFADNIHFFGKTVNFRTKPDGFMWNGSTFNPELYYEDDKEKELSFKGTKKYDGVEKEVSIKPMIKNTNTTQYSEGMLSILSELGLPTEE